MPELTAKRTLVKSPPELWEELSEVERLGKHLGAFGEIKITKLDPEHTVAWEGEHASGTVSIEPSGWGTRVTLTAELAAAVDSGEAGEVEHAADDEVEAPPLDGDRTDAAEPVPHHEETVDADGGDNGGAGSQETVDSEPPTQEPSPDTDERPPRRRGFWSRLFGEWLRGERWRAFPLPEPSQVEETEPAPVKLDDDELAAAVPAHRAHEPGTQEDDLATAVPEHGEDEAGTQEDDLLTEFDAAPAEPVAIRDPDDPEAIDPEHAQSVLDQTLDSLGSAHHRPFSRG